MANTRVTRTKAFNRVNAGPRSGPALERVRGTPPGANVPTEEREPGVLPTIRAAAQRYTARLFKVRGGLQRDPVTRVERYVGPGDYTPTQAQAEETAAHVEFQGTVNGALTAADRDLQLVQHIHERLPPPGRELILPPNRGGELQAVSTLLLAGTFAQWHGMCQTALDTDDRPLAEVCAFVGAARVDEWHADRAGVEADLQALEDGFATEASLSGEYAQALVGQMRAALESVSKTLGRSDGVQQVLVSHEPLWNALRPLPAQLDVEEHWWSVLRPAKAVATPASDVPLKLVGDTPSTVRLEAIDGEKLGPLRTAADAGPGAV